MSGSFGSVSSLLRKPLLVALLLGAAVTAYFTVCAASGTFIDTPLIMTVLFLSSCGGYWWLQRPEDRKLEWLLALLGAGAIWSLVGWCGMRQFGGFDQSVPIDIAWRHVCGQKPYVDYPCTLPPAFVWGAQSAFDWFGVSWRSLISIAAAFAVVTFLWSFVLLRTIRWTSHIVLIAFSIQAMTSIMVSYWWYNPIASVSGTLFLLSAICFLRQPRSPVSLVSYILSLTLLAAMKPNVAGILIIMVSIVLFTKRDLWWRTLALSAAAFVIYIGILALKGMTLLQVLQGYMAIMGRGFSLEQFLQDTSPGEKALALTVLAGLLAPWLMVFWRKWRPPVDRQAALGVAGFLAGLYGFVTNGESKLVDAPLLFLGTLCFVEPRLAEVDIASARRIIANGLRWFACVLAGAGIALGMTRHRVQAIGYGLFFESRLLETPIEGPFFAGMRTGPTFRITFSEVSRAVAEGQGKRFYFGPRMQWAYAAFGIEPPRNQPAWWHPGVSFSPKDEPLYIERWKESKFDVVILYHQDVTYMHPSLIAWIGGHYELDSEGYRRVSVLRRKAGVE